MRATVLPSAVGAQVDAALADTLADEVEAWLRDPARTAHRLVSLPTAELVRQSLAQQPAPARPTRATKSPVPARAWRVLPDRLLPHHPRRGDALQRLRITPAGHLALTAVVLERWGRGQSGGRLRTPSGRRCILGAQRVVCSLGYGTEVTAAEAGRLLNGALARRGERRPYPEWNESPRVTDAMAIALVREAAGGGR